MNEHKFDGLGELYSKYRPSYPQALIDYLFSSVGLNSACILADIGSGTGKFTKLLLEKAQRVYAVEPNENMRKIAKSDLDHFANFVSVNGTAESTTLPDRCCSGVIAAQAFHWFDQAVFQAECRRILKPGGKVFLIWNSRDEQSAITRENAQINRKFCPDFYGFSGGIQLGKIDFSDFFAGVYETVVFDHPLQFDLEGFIGRNLSSSYAPKKADPQYSAYVAALKSLFEKYKKGDSLTLPNLTRCYAGTV